MVMRLRLPCHHGRRAARKREPDGRELAGPRGGWGRRPVTSPRSGPACPRGCRSRFATRVQDGGGEPGHVPGPGVGAAPACSGACRRGPGLGRVTPETVGTRARRAARSSPPGPSRRGVDHPGAQWSRRGRGGWRAPGSPLQGSRGTVRALPRRTTRPGRPGRRSPVRPPGRRHTRCSRWSRTKRWVWSGAPKKSNSHGAHSSGSLPDQSSGVSRLAFRELMNAWSLLVAAASPPMSDASAPRSCGTDQVYCTALPSSKPSCPPGSSWDASNASPGGKLPSAPRACT